MSVKSGHRARLCGTAEVLEYFREHPGATLAHAVDGLGRENCARSAQSGPSGFDYAGGLQAIEIHGRKP